MLFDRIGDDRVQKCGWQACFVGSAVVEQSDDLLEITDPILGSEQVDASFFKARGHPLLGRVGYGFSCW